MKIIFRNSIVFALFLCLALLASCAKQTESSETAPETNPIDADAPDEEPEEAAPDWNGLPLSGEYDDYSFELIREENSLPFTIDMIVEESSVRYNNKEIVSYLENNGEKPSDQDYTEYKSYMPQLNIYSLVYDPMICLKDNASEQNSYELLVWNDRETVFHAALSKEPTQIPIKIGGRYTFVLFSEDRIASVGILHIPVEMNNKVIIDYDFWEANDADRIDKSEENETVKTSGYYRTVVISDDFTKETANDPENYPIYETNYYSQGEIIDINVPWENYTVYRAPSIFQ